MHSGAIVYILRNQFFVLGSSPDEPFSSHALSKKQPNLHHLFLDLSVCLSLFLQDFFFKTNST